MREFIYKIKSENGIHARPAGMLVKCASGFPTKITILLGEKSADAKRLFSIMGLGAKKDDEIKVRIEYNAISDGEASGSDSGGDLEEERAENELRSFIEQNF